MPTQVSGNAGVLIDMVQAVLGGPINNATYVGQLNALNNASSSLAYYLNLYVNFNFGGVSDSSVATSILNNLLEQDPTNSRVLNDAVTQLLAANPLNRGVVVYQLTQALSNLEGDPTFGAAAVAWNNAVYDTYTKSSTPGYTNPPPPPPGGPVNVSELASTTHSLAGEPGLGKVEIAGLPGPHSAFV